MNYSKEQIQQAIDKQFPVFIDRSYYFQDKPTKILSFCGNPDLVKVDGSTDSYETYRLNIVYPIKNIKDGVVIVGEHINECRAFEWVHDKSKEWNIIDMKQIPCKDTGEVLKQEESGSIWYEYSCMDKNCGCKLRIKSKIILKEILK